MKLRLPFTWIAVITLWVLFLIPFDAARAQETEDIQFLESREISLSLPAGEASVPFELRVINSSAEPMDITLELPRLSNEDDAALPSGAVEVVPQTAKAIMPGQQHTYRVSFKRAKELKGTYTGELVAVGSNGSIARLPIKLVVDADQPPLK